MGIKAMKPRAVINLGVALMVAWALGVYAAEPPTAELYSECCARCHGASGHGDGPDADELPDRPRNFTDCKSMAALTDAVLFQAIKKGGAAVGLPGSMPSWETALDDHQIRQLIGYVRQFCGRAADARNPRATTSGRE
jgi:cytochrome c oxidase cbb3-type subunit III